jgi:hypothetical protein
MKFQSAVLTLVSFVTPLTAMATEFEPLQKALTAALGTDKAFKKKYSVEGKDYDLFYSKDAKGNALKFASIQKAIYAPDCTHTWVVAMKAQPKVEVTEVRVVEMSCKHAFPAKSKSFLSQYEGKKVADAKTLDKSISLASVATATYTGIYTTDAVKRSLLLADQFKP